RRIEFTAPKHEYQTKINKRLHKLQTELRLPGFRPGKIPAQFIQKNYLKSVKQEVLTNMFGDELSKIIQDHQLNVIDLQEYKEIHSENHDVLLCEIHFEIYPEFSIPSFDGIELKQYSCEITPESIQKTITILLQKYRTFSPSSETSAINGKRAMVDFEGKIDGQPFTGGKADDFSFVLGENTMLLDFEQGVLGMSKGESREVLVNFPEDYASKEVAGKTASFNIHLKAIDDVQEPLVNESLLNQLGIEGHSMEDLQEQVKQTMQKEVYTRIVPINFSEISNWLSNHADFPLPQKYLQEEILALSFDARNHLKSNGMKDVEKIDLPPTLFLENAKKKVKSRLIFSKLIEDYELSPTSTQVQEYINLIASSYEQPDEVKGVIFNDSNELAKIKDLITQKNIIDLFHSKAKVVIEELPFNKLVQAPN
ncbi:MAG: trigger factor, partial [Gammaproteobacteria bacterium]|nr:trigger factor [Gammaproteobacteria bacterium]